MFRSIIRRIFPCFSRYRQERDNLMLFVTQSEVDVLSSMFVQNPYRDVARYMVECFQMNSQIPKMAIQQCTNPNVNWVKIYEQLRNVSSEATQYYTEDIVRYLLRFNRVRDTMDVISMVPYTINLHPLFINDVILQLPRCNAQAHLPATVEEMTRWLTYLRQIDIQIFENTRYHHA